MLLLRADESLVSIKGANPLFLTTETFLSLDPEVASLYDSFIGYIELVVELKVTLSRLLCQFRPAFRSAI